MSGQKDIESLLQSLSPQLLEGEFVFQSFKNARYGDYAELQPIASIQETEGMTLLISKTTADERSLGYDAVFRAITLKAHSSLEAVGLTSAFSTKLAERGISANVVAGFYHDHIFVQTESAGAAMAALNEFSP